MKIEYETNNYHFMVIFSPFRRISTGVETCWNVAGHQAFCSRWVSSGAFSDLVRQADPGAPQELREFNLLDWCAPSSLAKHLKTDELVRRRNRKKLGGQKTIKENYNQPIDP